MKNEKETNENIRSNLEVFRTPHKINVRFVVQCDVRLCKTFFEELVSKESDHVDIMIEKEIGRAKERVVKKVVSLTRTECEPRYSVVELEKIASNLGSGLGIHQGVWELIEFLKDKKKVQEALHE